MKIAISTLLAIVTLSVGCATASNQHVQLDAPAKDAPLAERQKAWRKLAPVGLAQTTTVSVSKYSASTSTSLDYIALADGTRVVFPEDFLAVVDADSPTAKQANIYVQEVAAYRPWAMTNLVGGSAFLLGGGGALASLAVPDDGSAGGLFEFRSTRSQVLLVSAGVGVVGLIAVAVAGFGGNGHIQQASAARESAFIAYPQSLADHLGLSDDAEPATAEPKSDESAM